LAGAFAAIFYCLATGQRIPDPSPTNTPVFMHSAAAASQPEGPVFNRVESRARPIDSLHICAPVEHEVGCRWAQAGEEVDKINVEVRRPPDSAIARAKPKIVRAFRICFSNEL
jgi:hypothetical protein